MEKAWRRRYAEPSSQSGRLDPALLRAKFLNVVMQGVRVVRVGALPAPNGRPHKIALGFVGMFADPEIVPLAEHLVHFADGVVLRTVQEHAAREDMVFQKVLPVLAIVVVHEMTEHVIDAVGLPAAGMDAKALVHRHVNDEASADGPG